MATLRALALAFCFVAVTARILEDVDSAATAPPAPTAVADKSSWTVPEVVRLVIGVVSLLSVWLIFFWDKDNKAKAALQSKLDAANLAKEAREHADGLARQTREHADWLALQAKGDGARIARQVREELAGWNMPGGLERSITGLDGSPQAPNARESVEHVPSAIDDTAVADGLKDRRHIIFTKEPECCEQLKTLARKHADGLARKARKHADGLARQARKHADGLPRQAREHAARIARQAKGDAARTARQVRKHADGLARQAREHAARIARQ